MRSVFNELTLTFWKRTAGFFILAMLSLTLSRLVFYFNCSHYFQVESSAILHAFLLGLRFDLVSIAYLLGPFYIACLFVRSRNGQLLLHLYFVGILSAMNFLNCIDAEFFKFTARRSTDDLFEFAFMSSDIIHIAPILIWDFKHLLAAMLLIFVLIVYGYAKLEHYFSSEIPSRWSFIPMLFLLVVSARGGLQQTPLGIIDAGKVHNPNLNAVALNTSFTMLKTLGKPELISFHFFDQHENPHSPVVKLGKSPQFGTLKGSNVVVLIVESLSKEYMGSLNGLGKGYTPFIDSLLQHSLVYTNAYANGHRSIEGIPAVVASIPTLMYEPFITSRYAENDITSLASLLNDIGYYSSFMHGGNNGSMGFESFSRQAGFDEYYGRDQYPDQSHYDGHWGISDHYFLEHTVTEFSSYKKPFLSSIFTLSSHHPYTIPNPFKNMFPKGTLPIHESIGYADESLRLFFKSASKTDWYKNTLFVITADHTSLSYHPYYQTKTGSLAIPVLYYHPQHKWLKGSSDRVMQQTDIMPSVLDLLGYDKPFLAFGSSIFDSLERANAIAFQYSQYQIVEKNILLSFDGSKTTMVNNLKQDSLLQHNTIGDKSLNIGSTEEFLKGYLQNYCRALQNNRMTYQLWQKEE